MVGFKNSVYSFEFITNITIVIVEGRNLFEN